MIHINTCGGIFKNKILMTEHALQTEVNSCFYSQQVYYTPIASMHG